MALTVAGPVGCKQGSDGGGPARGKGPLRADRWRNWVAPQFSALIGKYALTACAIRSLWRMPRRCFFDGSGDNVVSASVRLALRVLNRRADQQRLVDGSFDALKKGLETRHAPQLGLRQGRRGRSKSLAAPRPNVAALNARNMIADHALLSTRCAARRSRHSGIEGTMATRQQHQIVETPTEARQAEPGPSVLALLTVSTGLAILILGVVWFVFFRI